MYSREDKLRAVGPFVKYDFSLQSAINEFGYSSRGFIYNWCGEYLENEDDIPDKNSCQRYGSGLKRMAVDHCFEHGRCLARTCWMRG